MDDAMRSKAENEILDILDARQAAKFLNLHEETLRRLARERKIPSYKIGGSWRFSKRMLYRWAETQQVMRTKKVALVIDDEASIREFVSVTLEAGGYSTLTAANGTIALNLMRHRVPDIVLLDLRLPEMDGPTTLKMIREVYGAIPVIVITGFPDSQLMAEALRYSPFMLLSKPFFPSQLLQSVQMALGGSTESNDVEALA